jgi:hypothetical protein
VTLNARQSWKGVDPGVVEVVTSGTGASCGYDFKIGRRYLVFATGGGGDGRLNVSLCSFTREFDGRGESADFLASLGAPETGGRVFGSIQANYRSFEPRGDGMTRVPIELEVRLTGDGRTVSTKTSGGRYSFARLPAGAYEVEIVMPDGYSTWRSTQPAEIPSARACAEVDFYLAPAGRIAGMLASKTGAAISEVEVQVTGADTPLHQSYLPFVSARSDARGHFEVRDLPPGRYVIGINLRDLPNQWTAYPRIMYPGGDEPPSVIDLSLGQAADLGQWLLPPPLAGIKLPGVITWRDGTPAAGVYVSLWDVSPYPNDGLRGAGGGTSGPDGRFVVEAREGRRYRFVARVGGTGPALMLAAPQIEASPGLAPLRLVIQSDPR